MPDTPRAPTAIAAAKAHNIPDVAAALGVRYVLEGSVPRPATGYALPRS
ncbi:MAG: hypothetical protein VCC99_12970 [Alphaproteobacteria bacterium]